LCSRAPWMEMVSGAELVSGLACNMVSLEF